MNLVSRLWGGLAVSTLIISGMLVASSATADTSIPAPDGLAQFGTCLTSEGTGSLVILLDQSGSLRQTDPDKSRIDAGKYLTERMASFADASGIKLDVRVAGFAADYEAEGEWTTLTSESLGSVQDSITTAGNQIFDYDTDYWIALEDARQELTSHNESPDACRAIAWFTDGEYDIDARKTKSAQDRFGTEKTYAPGIRITDDEGAKAAMNLGKTDICRPAGLADQLRSSGISILGIGLAVDDPDFTFLRSVTQGGGTNAKANTVEQCGLVSEPTGTFHQVSDLDSLYMAFDAISAPGQTLDTKDVGICQGEVCAMGESQFVLDPSIKNVHIMSSSNVEGLSAYLYGPGADEPVELVNEGIKKPLDANGISYTWLTERTLEVNLTETELPTWDGLWRMVFVDNAANSEGKEVALNIQLSSTLVPSWQNLDAATIRTGEKVKNVQFGILDTPGGSPIDPMSLKGDIRYLVELKDSAGESTVLFETTDKNALVNPIELEIADLALGRGKIINRLEITTGATQDAEGKPILGTALAPATTSAAVDILGPLNFPSVTGAINFGLLEKEKKSQTVLEVTGPGCAWIDDGSALFTGKPGEAGELAVSSPANSQEACIQLGEGATGELPITLTTSEHANGAVTGTVEVILASFESLEDQRSVAVDFTADMRRPIDANLAWTTFFLVLFIGIAIPVAGLYLFKYFSSRIAPGTLATAIVRVRLPESKNDRSEILVPRTQITVSAVPKGKRTLEVGNYTFKARMGLLPTSAARIELDSLEPSVSGSSPSMKAGKAVIPMSLRGQWVAVLDQPDSPTSVSLIILSAVSSEAGIEKIVENARRSLAARVESAAHINPSVGSSKSGGTKTEQPRGGNGSGGMPKSPFGGDEQSPFGAPSPFGNASPFDAPKPGSPFEGPSSL